MASESPSRNDRERRDAFDKAGYWPNQIMWKAWCQSWTASRRAALTDAAVECEALGRMAPNNERGFAYDIAAKVIRELIAAPQEGAVSPAGPAANGEPAAAASVVLSEIEERWIDAKVRRPCDGDTVFVHEKDGGVCLAVYSQGRYLGDGFAEESGHTYTYNDVTHWMPAKLPKEPK